MKSFVVALLLILILAACGTNVPENTDWCFRYNFAASDYGASIVSGSWESGEGFVTNGSGDLSFGITHAYIVQPAGIVLTADRGVGTTGAIDVLATGEVFGVSALIDDPLPDGFSTVQLSFTPANAGENGTTINITAQASQEIAIRQIDIVGFFENPFGSSNCDNPDTLTPVPAPTETPEPSETPIPTETEIPTETPYPTPTPQPWCFMLLNGASLPVWVTSPYGSGMPNDHVGTMGGISADAWWEAGISIVFPSTTTLTYVKMVSSGVPTRDYATSAWSRQVYYASLTGLLIDQTGHDLTSWSNLENEWSGTFAVDNLFFLSVARDNGWADGSTTIHEIELHGTGTNPFPVDNCNDPTPTPSLTRTPTPTRTPSITRTPSLTRTPNSLTLTALTSPTVTPTRTPNAQTRTAIASRTPTRTRVPVDVPPTNTPFIITATPAPITQTWIASTLTALPTATDGTPSTATVIAPGTPFPDETPDPNGTAGDIVGLAGQIIGFVTNAIQLGWSWLGQIGAALNNVINAWYDAPTTPIPNLPQCMTNPLSSNLCAIWYIVDNTVLAGVIGSAIVPVMTAVLGLMTILKFIRLAKGLLERLATLTKVD